MAQPRWACCLSQAPLALAEGDRLHEGVPPTANSNAASALIAELGQLKPSQLRKRAAAAGVTPEEMEEAEDGGATKESLIELIVALSSLSSIVRPLAAAALLVADLENLKPSQLRKRAAEAGVAAGQVEAAEDSDTPKESLIQLLMDAESAAAAHTVAETISAYGAETISARKTALSAELDQLKPSQLRKRAAAAGVTPEQIEEAEDGGAPKEALTQLLLEAESAAAAQQTGAHDALIAKLRQLPPSQLRKRATKAGVPGDQIEEAEDSDTPKESLIQLLVDGEANTSEASAQPAAADQTPHPLREELAQLGLGALRKRALAAGVSQADVDAALDADDAKQNLIGMVVRAHLQRDGAAEAERAELVAELMRLRIGGLQKRAAMEGAAADDLEAALDDADDPKKALIDLILQTRADAAAADGGKAPSGEQKRQAERERAEQKLREVLSAMRLGALQKRALLGGATAEEVESALDDGTDAKAALIRLCVDAELTSEMNVEQMSVRALSDAGKAGAREQKPPSQPRQTSAARSRSQPHFGMASDTTQPALAAAAASASAPAPAPTPTKPERARASVSGHHMPGGKHAMLSYSWGVQKRVTEVRKLLQQSGVKCWMDIDGGMQRDIFDSMAEGVTGAAVVLCFMSQDYQDSENCKLELKFARQTGVPIVPIMCENPDQWSASGWLGVITAGALWTPMWSDEHLTQEHVKTILSQINHASGATHEDGSASDEDADKDAANTGAEEVFTMGDMREELERLRSEATRRDPVRTDDTFLRDGPCALPAAVPDVPPGMRVTDQMNVLVDTTISEQSKLRVAFWGTGGIGKTTTSAWLCRQGIVRDHFRFILWVSLGQDPVLTQQQSVMFQQLTGSPMRNDLTQDEKREAIKQAMVGKDILLVLDDVWDDAHPAWFIFLDESTKSRVLMSSRVRGVLDTAETDIVNIGLPSEADSCSILMGSAGLDPNSTTPPTGATQIIAMCKRLPLTLGIAGRLIRDLSLEDNNWSDAVDLMRSELYGDGSAARSAEDRIIATSLKAITGPHKDNIRLLLRTFGLVPEDCKIPLEMLQWVMEAEAGPSLPKPSIQNLRRWVKALIDRSLVLGPVDAPSVHDLVLDFAVGLHSNEDLRAAHHRLVNLIRERRPGTPAHLSGSSKHTTNTRELIRRYGWDRSLIKDDRQSAYIVTHLEHHFGKAWAEDWANDTEMISALDEYANQQDVVPVAAATVLGPDRSTELAKRSESEGKWWAASCRWTAIATAVKTSTGMMEAKPFLVLAAASLEKVKPTSLLAQLQKDSLEMTTLLTILLYWNPVDLGVYKDRCAALMQSEVAKTDPELAYMILQSTDFFPAFICPHPVGSDSVKKFGAAAYRLSSVLMDAAMKFEKGRHERTLYLCEIYGFLSTRHFDQAAEVEEWDWEKMCGKGGSLLTEAVENYNYDTMHNRCCEITSCDGTCAGSGSMLLVHVFGDPAAANRVMDKVLNLIKRRLAEPDPTITTMMIGLFVPWKLHLLERNEEAIQLMLKMKLDWDNIESSVAVWEKEIDAVGVEAGNMMNPMDLVWHLKSMWKLFNDEETPQQVLPSGKEMSICGILAPLDFHTGHTSGCTSCIWSALAHEKFGRPEEALECAAMVTEDDMSKGGDCTVWAKSLAYRCIGRVLARRGERGEAAVAFESAVSQATSRGYQYLAAVALREMIAHVPEERLVSSGGGSETRQVRLARAMSQLALSEAELEGKCQLE